MALSLEQRILNQKYGIWLWAMRLQPWHAAYWLTGVFVPPHERFWLGVYFGDAKENNVLASRGTSKSFTHASFAAPLKAMLYKNISILCLSNSGFRGGKELFKDAERLVLGQLKSQEPPGAYLHASIASARVIQKDPSIWTMPFKSQSRYSTAPTNNPDQLRGLRATHVLIDERGFMADEIPQKIIRPMLVVGSDFRRTATGADRNQMYQISTIDFSIRGWWGELQVAERLQRDEFAAWKARKDGDWKEYDRLMNENEGELRSASFTYSRFDYTDLLIPTVVTTLDGEHRYRVNYPLDQGITADDITKFDPQDNISYIYTYPVDKKSLEEGNRNGTVDSEIWLAEQRNVPISASGNVFDHDLIQKIAERPIAIGDNKVKRTKAADEDVESEDEFYAPVMMTCGDPCVLGVDVARESDETAFVVIRLGELAEGEFTPFVPTHDDKGRQTLGKTPWNHIVWAESWKKMEAGAIAAKIHDFYARYNILYTIGIPGIAIDKRGGGTAVRDELGNPKPPVIDGKPDPKWSRDSVLKMFDPEDEDFMHYAGFNDPKQYWGGLRLLATTNGDNVDWTFGTRAMMQQKKLYIAYWMPPSRWAWEKGLLNAMGEPDRFHPEFQRWEIGYNGVRRLKMQLLRIQTKVSEQAVMRFVMPGDRAKEEGKKDLWAAMIYAVSIAREHIIARTKKSNEAPMVEPLLVDMSQSQSLNNRLFGSADSMPGHWRKR